MFCYTPFDGNQQLKGVTKQGNTEKVKTPFNGHFQ